MSIFGKFLKDGITSIRDKIRSILPNRSISVEEIISTVSSVWEKPDDRKQIADIIIEFDKEEQKRIVATIDRLNDDIQKLDKRKEELVVITKNIKLIETADISTINKSIEKLNELVNAKTHAIKFTPYKLKSTDSFDAILKRNNLLTQFQHREIERRKKEEEYKKQVRSTLDKISTLLNQDELSEAKQLINQISGKINKSYKHEIERLEKLIQKLKDKERLILIQKQEAERKRFEEEAKRLREEVENREKAEREKKEREEHERNAILEQEKAKLEALLVKKSNWQEFQQILQQNNIANLYHFTDRANINSIKQYEGLYSWSYCDKHNIVIPKPGGSMGSRGNDWTNGKVDYVRVAFTKGHPMCYVAQKDGRISNVVWLEISPEIVFWQNTEFADKNAAAFSSYRATIGGTIQHLRNVKFDILEKGLRVQHYNLDENEKPYNQAEVLVKTWIPIDYITNINNF
jgi:hypothetical protein